MNRSYELQELQELQVDLVLPGLVAVRVALLEGKVQRDTCNRKRNICIINICNFNLYQIAQHRIINICNFVAPGRRGARRRA